MASVRQRPGRTGKPLENINDSYSTDPREARQKPVHSYTIAHLAGLVLHLAVLVYAVNIADNYLPKPKGMEASSLEFSAARARKHLVAITRLGARPSGSYENDVLAAEYILREINSIRRTAHQGVTIEAHSHTADGSYSYERKSFGIGFTAAYQNITNIVARIAPANGPPSNGSLLINAHFDTVPNTEGASDDTVSCAVMLEMLRTLSRDPSFIQHPAVFLFNGAEEGGLLGSHSFVSTHPWMKEVRTVVNMEAAGSGGREFVFQTGPQHPWILEAYARSAKYPFASVVAQEIFQSDIIPSDTDFRVFREYGNLNGIDMAFARNGYVYHTKYDDAKSIASGSIQRAGENVLELVKAISHSEHLTNPAEYKHGDTIFFDVLGSFMIHYPKRLHLLLNTVVSVAILVFIAFRVLFRRAPDHREHGEDRISPTSPASVALSLIVIVASWLVAIAAAFGLANALVALDWTMSWYSWPTFGLALYGLPSLFGMMLVHYVSHGLLKRVSIVSIRSFLYAHLFLFSTLLLFINRYSISSSFILFFWIVFPFVFTVILMDVLPLLPDKRHTGVFFLHLLGVSIPGLVSVYHIQILIQFFFPLFGRMGTDLPTDLVAAVFAAISVIIVFTFLVPLFHLSYNMRRLLCFVFILSTLPLLYLASGRVFPYSAENPTTPKRMYLQHTLRTFYLPDGSIRKQDSGIWFQAIDYRKIKDFENIPFYENVTSLPCEDVYCGLPFYYAMRRIIRQHWYLHGPKPDNEEMKPLNKQVYQRIQVASNRIRYEFDIEGPDHMNVYISTATGTKLTDWSFYKSPETGYITSTPDYVGGDVHFIFFSKGFVSGSWKFWLEFEVLGEVASSGLAEVAIGRLYVHGKKSRTKFLSDAIQALPKWTTENSWTSNYDSFQLS